MTARFQLPDGGPRVAVHTGSGAVDDGDGDVRLQLAHPVDHRPLGPAVGDGHVPKGRLAAAERQEVHEVVEEKGTLNTLKSLNGEGPEGDAVNGRGAGGPGALHVHVEDVVWDGVVAEHGRELLLEVGPQNLDQGWTCRAHNDFATKT